MADTAHTARRMSPREFLEWEAQQPRKHEFVDGLVRMMAGGTKAHEKIARNILSRLTEKLRGRPCEPYGSDLQVQTLPGPIYYPDVLVDCGTDVNEALHADKPTVIFEVLSKSTREIDLGEKLANYQATPAVQEIVYVEQTQMRCLVWRRGADGWETSEINTPEASVRLQALGVALSVAEIYDGLRFA